MTEELPIVGMEHVHHHSDFSLLDGLSMVEEYAARWKAYGDYLCITDHGMMAAIPRLVKACEASGKKDDPYKNKKLNPIFGSELYINPYQIGYNNDQELQQYIKSLDPKQLKGMRRRGYHLLALAYNQIGYSNLVKLCSWGWLKGFYYRPRINHEELQKHKEGIIFTSCCYASEIAQAFDEGGEEAGYAMIEKYISMLGKENFYLEIQLLDFSKQKPYDAFIVKAADQYGLKVIVTNDVHFCEPQDSKFQHLLLMAQTQKTMEDVQRSLAMDEEVFAMQDPNLWMKTEMEINAKYISDYRNIIPLEFFEQAKMNTVEICRRAQGVQLDRSIKLPQIPDANDKLLEYVRQGLKEKGLLNKLEYQKRIKEEYGLICHKEFASYFLIQKEMTDEARRVCKELLGWGDGGEAVGPGRGSAVGSLVCYCLGITDVEPHQAQLVV